MFLYMVHRLGLIVLREINTYITISKLVPVIYNLTCAELGDFLVSPAIVIGGVCCLTLSTSA